MTDENYNILNERFYELFYKKGPLDDEEAQELKDIMIQLSKHEDGCNKN